MNTKTIDVCLTNVRGITLSEGVAVVTVDIDGGWIGLYRQLSEVLFDLSEIKKEHRGVIDALFVNADRGPLGPALDGAASTDTMGELLMALRQIDALDPKGGIHAFSESAMAGLVMRMGLIARHAIAKAEAASAGEKK